MRTPKRTKVMAIVHGKSEYVICHAIKSNLKIKHEIYAENKGANSIQINGLLNILNNKVFKNYLTFTKTYPDIEQNNGKLVNFKLFIIMDLDDCSEDMREKFKSKEMFKKHWLYDYIVPVYNFPNLEKTMAEAKITVTKKKDYIKIFPTNHGDLDLNMAKDFRERLKNCKNSNFIEYVKYCIHLAIGE